MQSSNPCPKHRNNLMWVCFNSSCFEKGLVCENCIKERHQNHELMNVSAFMSLILESSELNNSVGQMRKDQSLLQSNKNELLNHFQILENSITDIIRRAKDRIIANFQCDESYLLSTIQAEERYLEGIRNINVQKQINQDTIMLLLNKITVQNNNPGYKMKVSTLRDEHQKTIQLISRKSTRIKGNVISETPKFAADLKTYLQQVESAIDAYDAKNKQQPTFRTNVRLESFGVQQELFGTQRSVSSVSPLPGFASTVEKKLPHLSPSNSFVEIRQSQVSNSGQKLNQIKQQNKDEGRLDRAHSNFDKDNSQAVQRELAQPINRSKSPIEQRSNNFQLNVPGLQASQSSQYPQQQQLQQLKLQQVQSQQIPQLKSSESLQQAPPQQLQNQFQSVQPPQEIKGRSTTPKKIFNSTAQQPQRIPSSQGKEIQQSYSENKQDQGNSQYSSAMKKNSDLQLNTSGQFQTSFQSPNNQNGNSGSVQNRTISDVSSIQGATIQSNSSLQKLKYTNDQNTLPTLEDEEYVSVSQSVKQQSRSQRPSASPLPGNSTQNNMLIQQSNEQYFPFQQQKQQQQQSRNQNILIAQNNNSQLNTSSHSSVPGLATPSPQLSVHQYQKTGSERSNSSLNVSYLGDGLLPLQIHEGAVVCLESIGNDRLVSGGVDCLLKVWERSELKLLNVLEGHQSYVSYIKCHQVSRILASGDGTGNIIIWRHSPQLQRAQTLSANSQHISGLTFQNERRLISGCMDGTIVIWDIEKGVSLLKLEQPNTSIQGIEIHANMLLGVSEKYVLFYELQTYKLLKKVEAHDDIIHSITLIKRNRGTSPYILTCSEDACLYIWDGADQYEEVDSIQEDNQMTNIQSFDYCISSDCLIYTCNSKVDSLSKIIQYDLKTKAKVKIADYSCKVNSVRIIQQDLFVGLDNNRLDVIKLSRNPPSIH